MTVYTIGFTQKSAEEFFHKIKSAEIRTLVDIRLNNKSQLAGFAKYPDIQFFLHELCQVAYLHDVLLAPGEMLLKNYRSGKTSWTEYVKEFNTTMEERKIQIHIRKKYEAYQNSKICLLCSEPTPEHCHRSLVAERFREIFHANVIHL